jgi:hypothetical protein
MRRLWVFKRRCHHGMTGCVLVALGIVLAYHDRSDYREWFALKRYEPRP